MIERPTYEVVGRVTLQKIEAMMMWSQRDYEDRHEAALRLVGASEEEIASALASLRAAHADNRRRALALCEQLGAPRE